MCLPGTPAGKKQRGSERKVAHEVDAHISVKCASKDTLAGLQARRDEGLMK
jgi:hypothetical protein